MVGEDRRQLSNRPVVVKQVAVVEAEGAAVEEAGVAVEVVVVVVKDQRNLLPINRRQSHRARNDQTSRSVKPLDET